MFLIVLPLLFIFTQARASSVISVTAEAQQPRSRGRFLQPSSAVVLLQEESSSGAQMRLEAGTHIRLTGLQSSVDLNGRQGTIQAFDPYSGRYVITMTSGGPSKRIRPQNVQLLELSEINDDPVADGERFNHGTHVMIFGMHQLQALNGKVGVIRHFDFGSGRYIVEIAGNPPRRIKPANLRPVTGKGSSLADVQATVDRSSHTAGGGAGAGANSICQASADDAGPNGWPKGTKVRLHSLRSATARPWNGLVGVVHCFLPSEKRYVVALPDGTPRKIKTNNLAAMDDGNGPPQEESSAGDGGPPQEQSSPRGGSGDQSEQQSVCKKTLDTGDTRGMQGPEGFKIGMKVTLHDLKSTTALMGNWNGMVGVVHCYDFLSKRYVVLCPDKVPRRLKGANLMLTSGGAPGVPPGPVPAAGQGGAAAPPTGAASICKLQATKGFKGPAGFTIGAKVKLHGLKSAAAQKGGWNGMVGVVHCFIRAEKRVVVACPDGVPRKLKLDNLEKVGATGPASQPDSEGAPQKGAAKSICGPQAGAVGPGALPIGTKVALFGLTSKAAISGHWNGMVGILHCFDASSQRYVVALNDGHPRKIKVENLAIVTTAVTKSAQSPATGNSTKPQHVTWTIGAYVRLFGLRQSAELNGQVASIVAFDNTTKRYTVRVPGMARLKKIRVNNLADVSSSEPALASVLPAVANALGAPSASTGNGQPESDHKLSICNAYATSAPIQVFAVSSDGKHYTHIVKNLDFQSCSDVDNLPADTVGSLAFILGKFQVAKKTVDFSTLTPGQGLELVVSRKDPNSLQATVHQNPVEIGDTEAYYLHIINAYAGRKSLELHVQRGKFLKKLPLDKTFRLSTTKAINMVLSDGTQKLRLNFQPRLAQTYCIMTTGVDEGIRGEPRSVGLVAHEIGTWTSSEEMMNPDINEQGAGTSATGQAGAEVEDLRDDASAHAQKPSSPGLASVLGDFFGGSR